MSNPLSSPRVLVATLLCDRKAESQKIAPPAMYKLRYPNKSLYFNVQTSDFDGTFAPLKKLMGSNIRTSTEYDVWDYKKSTWWNAPQFDQDQARLVPICIARNMAVDAALLGGYDYLFFVDADVVVPADSIERLMAHGKPLVSGLVPGRGAHGHVHYVFHPRQQVKPNLLACGHATCGFTLIERRLFEVLRFRQGPHPVERQVHLSEDPAFGADAEVVWGITDAWYVDTSLMAAHMDEPGKALSLEETSAF